MKKKNRLYKPTIKKNQSTYPICYCCGNLIYLDAVSVRVKPSEYVRSRLVYCHRDCAVREGLT